MKQLFSLNGKVYQVLNIGTQLVELNLLVLLMCLPVVTIGASLTTMYAIIFKMNDQTIGSMWTTFWQVFIKEWKKSTILWVMMVAVFSVIGLVYWLIAVRIQANVIVMLPLLVVLALFLLSAGYLFPLQARFSLTVGQTLRNALTLSLQNVLESGLIFVLAVVLIVYVPLIQWRLFFLWVFFGFSLTGYLQSWLLERVFDRYMN